jgi:hypothetical protein
MVAWSIWDVEEMVVVKDSEVKEEKRVMFK